MKVADGYGIASSVMTGISVIDDFRNNSTLTEKLESSGIDIGMGAGGYALGTAAIEGIGIVGIGILANKVASGIKGWLNLN